MTTPKDELTLVNTDAMRARRHPLAIAALWAWESVLALVIAWPVAAVAETATGGPGGDAVLWKAGGRALLDVLVHERHAIFGMTRLAAAVFVVAVVAGLVPLAALLTTLAYAVRDASDDERVRGPGLVRSLTEGLLAFPAMAVLLIAATAVEGVLVGLGVALSSAVEGWASSGLGEARTDEAQAVVLIATLALTSGVGVLHDLGRAAVVRFQVSGPRAIGLAVRALRGAALTTWWSWAWRALASLAPIVAAAWVAERVGGRGGLSLGALAAIHQVVVASRVGLRSSWLARALRTVDGALRRAPARVRESLEVTPT